MKAYVLKDKSATSISYERNPYFPFVDPEGNQLPYIDKLRIKHIQDIEMYNEKMVTGEGTFAYSRTSLSRLPMYKSRKDKENYRVITGKMEHSAQVYFMPNMNHENSDIREVMQKADFRRALSLSINRKEINETLYFGTAEPSAATVHPSHPYYEDSYQKYIEFDPERAKELLDKIGVVDKNGDGWRQLPNGDTLNLQIVFFDYSDIVPKVLELVTSQWKEIGLKIEMKQQGYNLWEQQVMSAEHDITVIAQYLVGAFSVPAGVGPSSNYVPVVPSAWHSAHWIRWARWNQTDGESGTEPPEEIKQLVKDYEEAYSTVDEEKREKLTKKILETHAEKVWSIGTVGRWTRPLIVNDNARNVPDIFIRSGSALEYYPYHPTTIFFEGGEVAE